MFDLRLTVEIGEHRERYSVGQIIDWKGIYHEAWEPLHAVDDEVLACFNPSILIEAMSDSSEARIVMKKRKNAAKELAEGIAKMLLESMAEKDTINGYPVI